MNKPLNVLILENQPLISFSLKSAFHKINSSSKGLDFKIFLAKSCEEALQLIKKPHLNKAIDLVLLNINLPPSGLNKPYFADDLAVEVRQCSPKTKFIVLTNQCDNYRVNTIIRTFNPESILVHTDIDFKELILAIETVLHESPYYSKAILQFMRRCIKNDFILDQSDRLILYYLSKGTKAKDLPKLINLSESGVARRKRILKEVFNVERNNDGRLIEIAREKGVI
ncbi:DNA-binding response regulator [Tamlana sp. 2201CG12-4]|uniref:DNA-binding response regulator n=1 Tax=Tamlana sp. 2201CG12-4 TaxID=3112582 RepID=UPI002DBAA352|nr:DNA-binding response regulator [Tamlana sp. 2201CG12-4]MEC3906514.1 DNA-binding response regulator [Tamlana sp. 2201CG12-4]